MIEEHKFGSFVIDGKPFLGDIKIIDKKVRYWNDREKHFLKTKDIRELLEISPEIIIIGTGNTGLLEVEQQVKDQILAHRISLFVDTNLRAIEKYNNALKENKKIAAIFHATC